MANIIHVQTVMLQEELDQLKAKTGKQNTKDAMYEAVQHYLSCEHTKEKKE